nr:RNA-directed DNA polymerase, eukaryota [Tanacetum cinerariifolium]
MAPNDRGGSKYSNVTMLERLSRNVYITNFPKQLLAKELCYTCAKFGIVLDIYIPNKVSKQGKPFAIARFNKVNDVDLLIRNLRPVWMGNFHIYANVACFNRDTKPSSSQNSAFNEPLDVPKPSFAKEVTNWVPDFGEENSTPSEDNSDNNCVGTQNWVDAENDDDDEVVSDSFQSHVNEVSNVKGDANESNYVERTQKQPYVPSGDLFELEYLILKSSKKCTKVAQETNISEPKFSPGFTPLTSNHSENVNTKVTHEGCPSPVSKQVMNDHPPIQESEKPTNNLVDEGNTKFKSGPWQIRWYCVCLGKIVVPKEDIFSTDYFLCAEGTWLDTNLDILFMSVYSPQELSLKRELWSYMAEIINRWHDEVMVMGDFNEVRYASERYESSFHSLNATEFNRFIANYHLIDIPLGGYSFTWSDKHASKMSKLDWFLVSQGTLDLFPNLSGLILHHHILDHRPILLKESHVDYGPISFRLFHSWFLEQYFSSIIEDSCNNDGMYASNAMNRRHLAIKGVLIEGERIDNPSRVKTEFYNHFANRFSAPDWTRSPFEGQFPNRLDIEQSCDLEIEVTREEIKRAIWDCGSDKSPGPDGFTFEFSKKFWSIVGGDMINVVKEFFSSSTFPNGCNPLFIALIAKIRGCLISSKASVLVNGFPTDEFSFHRGLRQRDPLSPFLFIPVMESLYVSFQRLIDRGMFVPITVGKDNLVPISHLFYAYDAMFIGKWSYSNVNVLMLMLHCFFLASGLKGNVHKSSLYDVGVRPSDIKRMTSRFGCLANNLPFTYLGIDVGANMSRVNAWNEVVLKVTNKLSSWKAKTLSVGARVTLIKSVLGADMDQRKITWVCWLKVMAAKQHDRLEISSLFALNLALLFKCIWRFLSSQSGFWINVIKAIYGNNGFIDMPFTSRVLGSVWIGVLKAIAKLKDKGVDLIEFCNLVIGNGNISKFWLDKWRGDVCFKEKFHMSYNLEIHKDATIACKFQTSDLAFSFRRRPRSSIEKVIFQSSLSCSLW